MVKQLGHRWRCRAKDLNTIGANGTKVQLWDSNGWTNQNWTLESI
ncbi:RICIN domain-containing protein [Kitasatospora aureofaciens]